MNFDERMMQRLTNAEREIERLKVKESSGAWLDWTPTVTWSGGTTNPTTTTVTSSRYCKVGKLILFNIHLTIVVGSGDRTIVQITPPVTIGGGATTGSSRQTLTNATPSPVAVRLSVANNIWVYLPSAMTLDGYLIISGFYEAA